MALEGPEIEIAVPSDLLLDEAAADLHVTPRLGMASEEMKLSQY